MSKPQSQVHTNVSLILEAQADPAAKDLVSKWECEPRPRIEDYLGQLTEPDHSRLLRQLLLVEWQLRLRSGESPTGDEYLARFPEHAGVIHEIASHASTKLDHRVGQSSTDSNRPPPEFVRETPGDLKSPAGDSVSAFRDPNSTVDWNSGRKGTSPDEALPRLPGYEILSVLGRGGMGIVYQARDLQLKRMVALKMIRTVSADDDHRLRFRREAEAIARLQHPHVVQVYAVGEHAREPFVVLEFVDGGSLSQRINGTPLPPREAAQIVETLAQAMEAAHERGILHRDLKPANVLLTSEGVLKITDFGLAKNLDDDSGQTQTGDVMGTPSYMSPEQAAGRASEIGPSTDIYALGAILYELLTGRPPFRAATPMETLRQVIDEEPVPPRQLNPSTSRDLETIALKCLNKDRDHRYSSAAALAAELGRHRRGEPILARHTTRMERTWRWGRRHPAQAAALVTSLIAIVAIVGVLVGLRYQSQLRTANTELAGLNRRISEAQTSLETTLQREQVTSRQLETTLKREQVTSRQLAATQLKLQEAQRAQERVLYARRTFLAHEAWQNNELDRAEALLSECPEDLRHWEWYYLHRLCHSELRTLRFGKFDEITSVAFDPQGGRIACAARTITIWDIAEGRELLTIKGGVLKSQDRPDTGFVWGSVAFSPDGTRIVAGANSVGPGPEEKGVVGAPAVVFDAATSEEVLSLEDAPWGRLQVAFNPQGDRILVVSSESKRIRLWNAATGTVASDLQQPTAKGSVPDGGYECAAFSHDGRNVAAVVTGGQGGVVVWDVESGKQVIAYPLRYSTPKQSTAYPTPVGLAFSPDGKVIAGAGGSQLMQFGLYGYVEPASYDVPSGIGQSCFDSSHDGRFVLTGGFDGALQRWPMDGTLSSAPTMLKAHSGPILSVAINRNGSLMASAGKDRTVKIWKTDTAQGPAVFGRGNRGEYDSPFALNSDGTWMVRLEPAVEHEGQPTPRVAVFETSGGREKFEVVAKADHVTAVAVSKDDRLIATASSDGTARVWDVAAGRELRVLGGHGPRATTVAFSPDGERLLTGDSEGHVRVWNAWTGTLLVDTSRLSGYQPSVVEALFLSQDGRLIHVTTAFGARCLNASTGEEVRNLLRQNGKEQLRFYSAALSPDGTRLFCTGWESVFVLDAADYRILDRWRGHRGAVSDIACSPDGKRIATVGEDGLLKIWDPSSGQETFSAHVYDPCGDELAVQFDPQGQRLIISGAKVSVWDAGDFQHDRSGTDAQLREQGR